VTERVVREGVSGTGRVVIRGGGAAVGAAVSAARQSGESVGWLFRTAALPFRAAVQHKVAQAVVDLRPRVEVHSHRTLPLHVATDGTGVGVIVHYSNDIATISKFQTLIPIAKPTCVVLESNVWREYVESCGGIVLVMQDIKEEAFERERNRLRTKAG